MVPRCLRLLLSLLSDALCLHGPCGQFSSENGQSSRASSTTAPPGRRVDHRRDPHRDQQHTDHPATTDGSTAANEGVHEQWLSAFREEQVDKLKDRPADEDL
jgi:hypothetical protein